MYVTKNDVFVALQHLIRHGTFSLAEDTDVDSISLQPTAVHVSHEKLTSTLFRQGKRTS